MTKHQSALLKAIERAGGQEALAKAINVPQSTVSFWLNKAKKGVAAEKVADVERITLVPRHELRPDLFPLPVATALHDSPPQQHEGKLGHFSRYKHLRRDRFKAPRKSKRTFGRYVKNGLTVDGAPYLS
ncbi:MAG: YdaS family helix-turn-helix protein [Pseudolabrys sp.]